jgi:hypothetical protein
LLAQTRQRVRRRVASVVIFTTESGAGSDQAKQQKTEQMSAWLSETIGSPVES